MNEWEGIWKEVVVANFKVLSWHLHVGTEQNYRKHTISSVLGQIGCLAGMGVGGYLHSCKFNIHMRTLRQNRNLGPLRFYCCLCNVVINVCALM
jgi:hypothetical protein